MQDSSNESCLLKQVEMQELEAQEFGFYWKISTNSSTNSK